MRLDTMIKSAMLRSCSSPPLLLEAKNVHRKGLVSRSTISCSSSRTPANIPKLQPFSRTKFERAVKEPPLIEKTENELSGNGVFFFFFSLILKSLGGFLFDPY